MILYKNTITSLKGTLISRKIPVFFIFYSEIKQDENDQSEELIKDKSHNSVIIIGFDKSLKESKEAPMDDINQKDQNLKEEKKSVEEQLDKETKSKDIPLEKKEVHIVEQVINKKKVLNNACCFIL